MKIDLEKKNIYINSTSIIDEGAKIGKNCKIWHWVHISSGAKIGDDCSFGQNVFVGNKVIIGNNVKVQNNVSIYDNIILENNVFCGPSMVFTNVINPRSKYPRKNEYKTTLVKEGATLGANCTILCGIVIGENAFVGAGAVVTKNLAPYSLNVGNPSKQIGWMSEFGEKIPLPLKGNGSWICPKTENEYVLFNSKLKRVKK